MRPQMSEEACCALTFPTPSTYESPVWTSCRPFGMSTSTSRSAATVSNDSGLDQAESPNLRKHLFLLSELANENMNGVGSSLRWSSTRADAPAMSRGWPIHVFDRIPSGRPVLLRKMYGE